MRRLYRPALACLLLAIAGPLLAQDVNILRPPAELETMLGSQSVRIVSAEISRPKAKGDITLKAEVSFGGGEPMRIKLRKAMPGADDFNNVPRYDLAAQELQKLLVDPPEYLVPPTALRFLPLADFRQFTDSVKPTFRRSDEVLAVLQYWLQYVVVVEDVLDTGRFERDPVYARHIGQLNIFTFLIEHSDSNVGNFLISRAEQGPRVFSIDHGVAFASSESDRGKLWSKIRVTRLPEDTVARLRALQRETLEAKLAVLAEWTHDGERYMSRPPGENLSSSRGVRVDGPVVQMGLTRVEIARLWRKRDELLEMIDKGEIATF